MVSFSVVSLVLTVVLAVAIVRSTLELARNLKLIVVAEGVETQAVWQQLTDLGCAAAQGYLLSRPIPAADVAHWIVDHQTTTCSNSRADHAGMK